MALGASDAARFQAYQTRARMGAHIWARVILWTIVAWFALTFYVVWRQTDALYPELQRAYFWRWVLWTTVLRTPVLNRAAVRWWVPIDGSWYPLTSFTDWADSAKMYRLPFTSWYWHYGIRTALIPIGLAVVGLGWRVRHAVDAEHLRGLRLLPMRQHNRQLNGGWLTRTYHRATGESGIRIGSVTLPRTLEREHILIVGSTGSGKTTQGREIVHQVQKRGETAIIYDPDRDYIQEFYNESRGDIILNPVDIRCPFWSPWFELREQFKPIDAAALAASIIRGRPQNDTQEYFQRNARALVRGMFEAIPAKDRDNLEVFADFLKQSRDTLRAQLERTKAPAAIIDPGAHDSGGGTGIIGVTDQAIEGFGYMPRRNQTNRTWSARQWALEARGWIFLTSDSTTRNAVEAMQGIWIDALCRWLMERPYDAPHVWLLAEECPAMGYQPQLNHLANRGRKHNLTLIMCAQSISQLREIYGHDGATSLISAPSTKVILRVDETEMAEWASHQLGAHEIERLQMTQLAGLSTYREGVNLQPHRSVERIIMPDEIKLLPPFHGYLCVAGHHRTSIRISERRVEARQPAFLARTYNSDAPRTLSITSANRQGAWSNL